MTHDWVMKYQSALKKFENSTDPKEIERLKEIKMDLIFNKTDGSVYCLPYSSFSAIYNVVIEKTHLVLSHGAVGGLMSPENIKIFETETGLKFLHKMDYPSDKSKLKYAIFKIKDKTKFEEFKSKNNI